MKPTILAGTVLTEKTIPLPPILGGLGLASGIVFVILGARRQGQEGLITLCREK